VNPRAAAEARSVLDTLDLSLRLGKADYAGALRRLDFELPLLQRAVHEQGVPVLVLFEGWYASGRGDSMTQLVHRFDPRGYRVHVTHASSDEDRLRPWMFRFWRRLPPKGAVGIFDRSWYYLLWNRRADGELAQGELERHLTEVNAFERQLVDGGLVLIKYWLHLSQEAQRRRLKKWAKDETQRWRVSDEDWKRHRSYPARLEVAEDMLARSHTAHAPWTPIEAEDENHRRVKVLSAFADTLRAELLRRGVPEHTLRPADDSKAPRVAGSRDTMPARPKLPPDSPLARVDHGLALTREVYKRRLAAAQKKLRGLEFESYRQRRPVVIVFEGWDAAGKGGAIRRLTEHLDPRGYAVIPVAAPTGAELAQHYLFRFWAEVPKDGHWAIFDRSWYGRVLVERVEGFAAEPEWRRAYAEINDFERALSVHGTIVVKFWLEVSPEEQLARFRRRERTPSRQFKLTAEDWRNRAKWPQYYAAVTDMLRQTSTPYAPWVIVEANDKLWARVKVVETVVRALSRA
jgi:polyphosphate:AMP phosphotransferase